MAYSGSNSKIKRILLAIGLLWWACPAFAWVLSKEDVQVHGFLSQSYLYTTGNRFFGSSTNGSTNFRALGINASWRAHPNLLLSAQMLSRRAGRSSDDKPRLDYGFVDYRVYHDMHNQAGVRLGRIKNPLGLFNETRDVAFTRPSILLPQSFYLDGLGLRDFFLSTDGLGLYAAHRQGRHHWTLQLNAALPRDMGANEEAAFLGGEPGAGELRLQSGQIARLLYDQAEGRLRLAFTGVRVRTQYEPAAQDFLLAGRVPVESWMLSAQYTAESWSITSEYARRNFRQENFSTFPTQAFSQESFYLAANYRLAPRWELLLRYDAFFADRSDRGGKEIERLTGIPAHLFFAKDWTLALAWQISPAWLLRGEIHNIDGAAWLPRADNPGLASGDVDRYWNLFALQLSFRF